MAEKIIRDPVHDVIPLRLDRPADRLLFDLINCAEFQRLRRIKQLGMASFAYPGADHSRYAHSLGVMQTARTILDHLGQTVEISDPDRTACLAAALLHDLGHGPFSHVFERVSGIHHERLTRRVILDPESDVHRLLIRHDKLLPERVTGLFEPAGKRTFLNDLLSSQLDADRLDYLLRDNHMTGSRYGDFDLNWLVHALTVDPATGRLAVVAKGVSAVEAYLQSRYHMYRNVYFHKVVRSAEGMVKLALQRAKRLAVQDRLEGPARESTVYKALLGQRFSIGEFRDLDDVSVLYCFKLWSGSDDATLAGLCRGLLFRGLYKTIDLTHRADAAAARSAADAGAAAVTSAGGDATYDLFYDEPTDTPYEMTGPDVNEVVVIDPSGRATPFAKMSHLSLALNRELMFRRVHVKAEFRDIVAAAIDSVLGV
jgi:HD superfamily phosphohydrolase